MKKFILFLVIVLLFFIFYEKKADVGKEQKEFEATVDNFKKALDNVPAEIKKRKKAANNEYAEKKIESQESVLRDRVFSGVNVFRSRVTPVKKFAGIVIGVDKNGIVLVKNGKARYGLIMPTGSDGRVALIATNDELIFSGVIEGSGAGTNQEFLDKPVWRVAVSEFDDSALAVREKEFEFCIIKAGMPIEEICDKLVFFCKFLLKLKDNLTTTPYIAKFSDLPNIINIENFVVEFKEIEDVVNLPDVAFELLGSASIFDNIVGGVVGMKDGIQTISYVAKSHGITIRMPLYAARGAFTSDKQKQELNSMKEMFASDNFKKGDKLKLTGQVSFKPQDDGMPVMFVSPGFVLKK